MSDNSLPIGDQVPAHAAQLPSRTAELKGRYVTITGLDAAAHTSALWDALRGEANDSLWLYMGDGPYHDADAFRTSITRKSGSTDPVFYALSDTSTGLAIGYASLMRIDTANRVIEVGNIMYSPALARTPAATEAMYLLARYVFEELGYRRYEWKCNSHNAPSRAAALRLGFQYEGLFRQHMIIKGRNRDTAWFSMLDSEWPARKKAFETWLDPANFDASGRQKTPLARA
jgi:RimJ/RimL family protein N-acetyltransferase